MSALLYTPYHVFHTHAYNVIYHILYYVIMIAAFEARHCLHLYFLIITVIAHKQLNADITEVEVYQKYALIAK